MTVRIKSEVHRDAEYAHFRNIEFIVANPFDADWVTLKNGDDTFDVLWDDVRITKGRMPTPCEIEEGCWLDKNHIPQMLPINPMEDENG